MEFLLYLSPQGQQLIRDLISAKFHIHENIGFCYNSQMFGYADNPNKFVICTNNIRNGGWDMKHYISETVYHEAVHAAQMCNSNEPMGISAKSMPLPWNKLQDIENSAKVSKAYKVYQKEHEAYYFEDKPEEVRYYVRKFCF
jgi:hypothetical protein